MSFPATVADQFRARERKGREFPVVALVALAVIAAMTPLVLFSVLGLWRWAAAERADEVARVERTIASVASAADRALMENIKTAEAMAASRTLQTGNIKGFEDSAREVGVRVEAQFILIDPVTQQQLVNTFAPPGAPLPKSIRPADVARVVETGAPVVGPLAEEPYSRGFRFAVLVPATVEGDVRYVLAHLPGTMDLQAIVREVGLSDGWFASVLDGQGRIVARSDQHEAFYGRPASPEFLTRLKEQGGVVESIDLEGRAATTAYRRSSLGDWRYVVWVTRARLEEPRRRALGMVVGLGILALLASALAAWFVARSIAVPTRKLAVQAAHLRSGRPAPFSATVMREANVVGRTLDSTARELAEQQVELGRFVAELKERDEALRLALRAALAIAFNWDVAKDRVRQLYSQQGSDSQIVTFDTVANSVHPDDRAQFVRDVHAALDDPAIPYRSEYRVLSPDGVQRDVEAWGVVERGSAGRPVRLVGISMDVTGRKRAQMALAEATALLDTIFDTAPIGLGMWDRDFRFVRVNQRLADINGLPPEAHVGKRADEILPGIEGLDDLYRRWRNILETGEPWLDVEIEGSTPANPRRRQSWSESFYPIRVGARTVGIGAVVVETTERKAAEAVLRESEERFSAAFRSAPIPMSIRRLSDGTYVDVNDALLSARGFSREEVIGRTPLDAGLFADRQVYERTWQILREGGQLHAEEIELLNKDGSRATMLYSTAPITIGGEPHILTAAQDITQRKQSEEQVRMLLGEVSHRAKNLLGIVLAVARQTSYHGDPDDFVARLSERIQGLAESQDLLVHNAYRGIDLAALARAQLAHFAELVGTRILLDGPPVRVSAAAAQAIGMVFHELSTNAGKYGALSNTSGTVAIRWRVSGRGGAVEFHLSWTEAGGPPVVTPEHRGFGHTVMERMVAAAVGGSAQLELPAAGVRWSLTAPAAGVIDGSEEARTVRASE